MKYRKRRNWKYTLAEEEIFYTDIRRPGKVAAGANGLLLLTADGVLIIRAGYTWDGCSGTTIDRKTNQRAGLIHDALYQLMREGHLGQEWRERADQLLYEICVRDGMWERWARLYRGAVRNCAAYAAKSDILTAP